MDHRIDYFSASGTSRGGPVAASGFHRRIHLREAEHPGRELRHPGDGAPHRRRNHDCLDHRWTELTGAGAGVVAKNRGTRALGDF
jgi:hypothetical protein